MALARVYSRALIGIKALPVCVEVHLAGGLPGMSIVGLPETAVKESKDRVRAAIQNSHYEFPQRRVTVNLAPADLPKDGGRYDLPIAIGILAASSQLRCAEADYEHYEFIGELALNGDLRAVNGALPTAVAAGNNDRNLIVPMDNADEAAMARSVNVYAANNLLTVCAHLENRQTLAAHTAPKPLPVAAGSYPDLLDVKGQYQAKRALEIAAAGRHNLLMIGPPGTGKSMLATRLIGLLPDLRLDEALEAAALASITSTGLQLAHWQRPRIRSPHHTSSGIALVGGGSVPRPGEISLAHHGVLFLDELSEFARPVLDVLREPMESGLITVSRAARQAEFPADFQLIAAMNPCPCGNLDDPEKVCRCAPAQIARYRAKLSGPFLDRIDLHVQVPRVSRELLQGTDAKAESSALVAQRVFDARNRQINRSGKLNARLNNRDLQQCCGLKSADASLLDQAMDRLGLSARAYHRVLKIARTIADLACEKEIQTRHLSEAITYRTLDRQMH